MRYLLGLVCVVGCGSVSGTPQDAPKTNDSITVGDDGALPACGTAGAACCASNMCNADLACTTSDQICRASTIFIGALNSNTGMAYVLRGAGSAFTTDPIGMGSVTSIYGTAANDVWVIGAYNESGTNAQKSYARHWNGSIWETALPFASDGFVYALWGSAPNNYWAFTNGGGAYRWTGSSWGTVQPIDNGTVFTAAWGASATNIWAYAGNRESHYNGGWSSTTRADFSARRVTGVRATGMLWAGGSDPGGNNPRVLHTDGTTAVVDTLSMDNDCHEVFGIWAGPNDVWALSAGTLALGACTTTPRLFHRAGTGTWGEELGVAGWQNIMGMWGSSNKDIYMAGRNANGDPTVFHYNGTFWTGVYTANTVTLLGQLWASGSPN